MRIVDGSSDTLGYKYGSVFVLLSILPMPEWEIRLLLEIPERCDKLPILSHASGKKYVQGGTSHWCNNVGWHLNHMGKLATYVTKLAKKYNIYLKICASIVP